MRIFALELDNDIKGIERRKAYIEGLIEKLPKPDIVVLPELAICSYKQKPAELDRLIEVAKVKNIASSRADSPFERLSSTTSFANHVLAD